MVNIIIENLVDQIDDQWWDAGILEEMVDFFHDPDVAIMAGEQAYSNDNGIQCPDITTESWSVQVK